MNFLAPVAFGFAALLPVIVVFYFLKLKRRELPISSTYLWKKSIHDLRVNSPFQRLRKNLLLWLQLLLAALLVFALARPAMNMSSETGRRYICLIDTSASMAATDVSGGRIDMARREALRLVGDMTGNDQMMLVTFDAKPAVAVPFTGTKSRLRDAIRAVRPSEATTDFAKVVSLIRAIVADIEDAQVYLVSDGAFELEGMGDAPDAQLHYVKCGGAGENVGITAIDARRGIEDWDEPQLFVRVQNFGRLSAQVRLDLYHDDKLFDARDLEIDPQKGAAAVFSDAELTQGTVKAVISERDDLEADDAAWIKLVRPRAVRTLIVSEGNYFLELAVMQDRLCDHVFMKPDELDTALAEGGISMNDYDLVIFDRCAPATLPPGSYLFFGELPPLDSFRVVEQLSEPVVIDWDTFHPVNQHVNYSNLFLASAGQLEGPSDAHTLVETDSGPLVLWWSSSTHRVIVVGFDLFESRWPLRASFPIFLANTLRYFGASELAGQAANVRPGERIAFALPPGVEEVEVTLPGGRTIAVETTGDRVVFGDTKRCGLYRFDLGEEFSKTFVVNLADARESNLAGVDEIAWGETTVAAASKALKENREIWQWIALAGLAVLMVEWYIYNRQAYL